MANVKFIVPIEQQDRWREALEHTPETQATIALLQEFDRCVASGDPLAYGELDPALTQIFARLITP